MIFAKKTQGETHTPHELDPWDWMIPTTMKGETWPNIFMGNGGW